KVLFIDVGFTLREAPDHVRARFAESLAFPRDVHTATTDAAIVAQIVGTVQVDQQSQRHHVTSLPNPFERARIPVLVHERVRYPDPVQNGFVRWRSMGEEL